MTMRSQTYLMTGWKKTVVLYIIAVMMTGCGAGSQFAPGKGRKYRYVFSMVAPVVDRRMIFQDERLVVQFRFDDAAATFQLQNLSQENLSIDWPRTAIGVQGRFSHVRHSTTLYADTANHGASIILPPLGYVREVVIPYENISFNGESWQERDLLPTVDHGNAAIRSEILASVGSQVSVVLPVRLGTVEHVYEFAFRVDAVREISWRDFRPVRRVPEPPEIRKQPGLADQVTTAIIVVGLLGFIAFVLNTGKQPPTE